MTQGIVARFEKQPAERLERVITLAEKWADEGRDDVPVAVASFTTDGLVGGASLSGLDLFVWFEGGADGGDYHCTAIIATDKEVAPGKPLAEEIDFVVKVRATPSQTNDIGNVDGAETAAARAEDSRQGAEAAAAASLQHSQASAASALEALGYAEDAAAAARAEMLSAGIASAPPAVAGDNASAVQAVVSSRAGYVRLPLGERTVSALTLGAWDGVGGDKLMESRVLTNGWTVNGAFTEIKNLRFDLGAATGCALTFVGDGFNNFGNHVYNWRFAGLNGIDIGAIETKLQNVYGIGTGATSSGIGVNITNWDTSIHTLLLQDIGTGIRTNKGVQAVDAHVVRANVALNVRENGHPSQFVNTYLDTPRTYGAAFYDMKRATMVNTYVLNVGTADTAASANGFFFDATSSDNNVLVAHFEQNDQSLWLGGVGFADGSINNLLIGLSGAYKLSTNSRERIRRQTVMGCHDGWARHNNVPRFNRAYAPSVAVGAQTTLQFQLDWEYPALTFNTLLFVGTYVSRNQLSKGSVGQVFITIQYDDIGCSPVLQKLTGSPNNNWALLSASLSGSVLSVTVRNDGDSTAGISMEIRRSLDAIGSTY